MCSLVAHLRVESEKRLYPDLAIWKHEELIAVGSVRIYVTNGVGEIEGELTKLKSLKSRFKIYEGY